MTHQDPVREAEQPQAAGALRRLVRTGPAQVRGGLRGSGHPQAGLPLPLLLPGLRAPLQMRGE